MVVRNGEDEWVSEPGTSRVMALAQEPHSLNETQKKKQGVAETTQHRNEAPAGSEPSSEPDHKASMEPTETADQLAAASESAVSSLSGVVQNTTGISSNRNARLAVYAVVALVGLSLMSEVL